MTSSLPRTRKPSDLALDQGDVGTKFVTLVVVMMTVLATLAMGGALVVQSLRSSWVGAITGHITIEIPVTGADKSLREPQLLQKQADTVRAALSKDPGVESVRDVSRKEIENLVGPWLGDAARSDDLPLPALIAVILKNPDDDTAIARIDATSRSVDPAIITETHATWLSDLKRFSLVLLMAALAMASITIACSILTVAGAIKSRLAAHQGDIDLLHTMGATDDYIGGQFVRVIVQSVGRAALAGTLAGLFLLKIGGLVAGELQTAILPEFHWNMAAFLWFAALPALITALCWGAARFTVLRTLSVMP